MCCGVLQCVALHCSVLQWGRQGVGLWDIVCVLQCVEKCCSVLQRVAACCSKSQLAAVCCRVLQCAVSCCNMLQWGLWGEESWNSLASWCVLQCVAVCSVVQCGAMYFSVVQCVAVWCSALQCVAVCYSVLQLLNYFAFDSHSTKSNSVLIPNHESQE